jgi:hypothetical protein
LFRANNYGLDPYLCIILIFYHLNVGEQGEVNERDIVNLLHMTTLETGTLYSRELRQLTETNTNLKSARTSQDYTSLYIRNTLQKISTKTTKM